MNCNISLLRLRRIQSVSNAVLDRSQVRIFPCEKNDPDMNAKLTNNGIDFYMIIYVDNYRIQPGKVRQCIVERWNEERSGTWDENITVNASLRFTYEKNGTLQEDCGQLISTTKKERPRIPTAPFDLYGRVYREKYNGPCGYVNWEVKKGQPLPIKVEYGHRWRFYPDRTQYAEWNTIYYYKLSCDDNTDINSYRELRLEWN